MIKRGATRTWKVSTHVHCYFVNLLIFDLIQAIGKVPPPLCMYKIDLYPLVALFSGGMLDVKWVADAVSSDIPLLW